MLRRSLIVALLGALALAAPAMAAAPAGAAQPGAAEAADDAVAWLASVQEDDGGFELADFPGFETPDAVLAIATAGQSNPATWSRAEARAAVRALTRDGNDPLDHVDAFAEGGIGAGQAAKLISLVAAPLGLDARAFDPAADGSPVDLVAAMGEAAPGGWFGDQANFNGTLLAVLAHRALGLDVPPSTLAYVGDAQQAGGGWAFNGATEGADPGVDTTGYAVLALVAAGRGPGDPVVDGALRFLAEQHSSSGAWAAFGAPDPNATALATLAVHTAGFDVASACWRSRYAPAQASEPYVAPDAWLLGQQRSDGRFPSPSDAFGTNTFATSQAVQAILPGGYPVTPAAAPACAAYRLHALDGDVYGFGGAEPLGADAAGGATLVGAAGRADGDGFWQFFADGTVVAHGAATHHGDAADVALAAPVVGGAATASGGGYWLVAADGGVFSFGDASFHGSTGGIALNQPVVTMAADPDGAGYWLVASDGGVFAFDAPFLGSTGGIALNQPVVGTTADPDGSGYWMVARDGGIFAFDAPFLGSTGGIALNAPVVGMAALDGGYLLAAADGGVFDFGAAFSGSAAAVDLGGSPIVAVSR